MINATAHPQVIGDAPRAFLKGLRAYHQIVKRQAGPEATASKFQLRYYRSVNLFDRRRPSPKHDQGFIAALCTLVELNQRYYTPELLDRIYAGTSSKRRLSAEALASLRRLAKYVLYHMWAEGSLLLPASFKIEGSFTHRELEEISPELALFCRDFPPGGHAGKSTHLRMTLHVARWLVCTRWRKPEDVQLDDAVLLQTFFAEVKRGSSDVRWSSYFQGVAMFLREVLKAFPSRVSFTERDLKTFSEYYVRNLPQISSFTEIRPLIEQQIRESCDRRRARAAQQVRRSYKATNASRTPAPDQGPSLSAKDVVYALRSKRSGRWFADVTDLCFVENLLSDDVKERWELLFESYNHYRSSVRGLERFKSVEAALRVFADYISICLPVYRHFEQLAGTDSHPSSCIVARPAEFTRYPFIDRAADATFTAPTLREYISARFRSRLARYGHLNAIRIFFEYIELSYKDNIDIAGPLFRNPISQELDLPRAEKGNGRKTNKKPFARNIVPHLAKWLYAAEALGIYLRGKRISLPHGGAPIIDASEYGYVPVYRHLGRLYPVRFLPRRIVADIDGAQLGGLTYCRMFLLAVETGLRFQAIQWLCRETFDQHNRDRHAHDDVFVLWVNTDKVQSEFKTLILKRVRDMLLRQKEDEMSLRLQDQWIYYEGELNSRFEPLIPLFRNPTNGKPPSDNSYADVWVEALAAFQSHFAQVAEFVRLVKVGKPKTATVHRMPDGATLSPLSVRAIYTPHSCRATFVTRRSRFLSLGDVAELVGHADERVTSHYDVPEFDELADKLLHADRAVITSQAAPPTISAGAAFIHAEALNSHLQTSFRRDRDSTIKQFGIVSLSAALHRDDTGGTDALAVLRASPLALIIFRETHICPVGEECPVEVIELLGAARRCGGCPLACKSIDHLPAIAAKVRQLQEQIERIRQIFRARSASGAGAPELGELYDQIEALVEEMLAWRVSEEVLWAIRQEFERTGRDTIYVAYSELVQRHLQRVVHSSSAQETILRRIMEADEYPSMATDWLRFQVNVLKRRFMADLSVEGIDALERDPDDGIRSLASLVRTAMKVNGFSLEQVAAAILDPPVEEHGCSFVFLAPPSEESQ